ncbi:MAG: efflux RND transporter periplasmic adaptor subunit [Rhodospirillaceae bacterium]|nr:efflux RND transporter periplasmic adaptor subunit [Rhodospirillaceae bacterium]MCY4311291.1 efflux RND transporter periplasmic adaptor subunit [Rhodospirillaceae bacterium]
MPRGTFIAKKSRWTPSLSAAALANVLLAIGLSAPAFAETRAEPQARNSASGKIPEGRKGEPAMKAGAPKAGGAGAGGQRPRRDKPKTGGRPERSPTLVGVDLVHEKPLTQTEPVVGRIVATQQGEVAARVAGAVVDIKVAIGQRVKKGQVLARQDISSAEARLAHERAELKLAEQELKRFEALRTNQSAAFARARYDSAIHRMARARANVELAALAIQKAVILAPYSAVVVRKSTELGAYLKVGDAVAELVNDTTVEIEADVPADRQRGLKTGRTISFVFAEGGTRHDATVRTILPMQNALTRTVAVRFVPATGQEIAKMAINQAVTINVPVGPTRTVVSVHKDAIISRGPRRTVYVVTGGKAMPRTVEIGAGIGSRFVVQGGLRPGDIVVVRGNERLRPGQAVRHQPVDGAPSASAGQPKPAN